MRLQHPFSVASAAQVFMDNVYKLHGQPNTITSDRGTIFISQLWQEVFKIQGVGLQFSTAYHLKQMGPHLRHFMDMHPRHKIG